MNNLANCAPENRIGSKVYYTGAEILLFLQKSPHVRHAWDTREISLDPERVDALSLDLKWLDQVLRDSPQDVYEVFEIPKPSGTSRTIESPTGPAVMQKVRGPDGKERMESVLKNVQVQIARALQPVPFGNAAICAFRRNHSAYSGLRFMVDQFLWQEGVSFRESRDSDQSPQNITVKRSMNIEKLPEKSRVIEGVYQIDLRNFFPSVRQEWGEEALMKFLSSFLQGQWKTVDQNELKDVVALFMRLASYEGRLPQWAPSSPMLANIVAGARFDRQIPAKVAWGRQLVYGRYADDLVLLSNLPISLDTRQQVDSIIESAGFTIHPDKRVYEESKSTYAIWGTSLLSGRRDVLERGGYESHTFRIRPLVAERMTQEIFSLMDRVKTQDFQDRTAFHENAEVMRIFGLFSHAFNVSRFGGEWQESKNIHEFRKYALPRPMWFAWEVFKRNFWHFLSYNQKEIAFTVVRGDPVFDIRRWRAETVSHKKKWW